jgi:hypothetical protein
MANYLIQDKTLTDIADAIRAKTGGAEKLAPGDMPKEIAGIETGIQPTGTRNITQNGVFDVENYAKALVDVKPTLQEKTATGNGEVVPDEGFDGLSKVTVNIPKDVPKYQNKTITENGTHTADKGFDALSSVTVNVPIPEGYVKPEGTKEIDTNGIHDVSGKASAVVDVPVPDGYIQPSGTTQITENGTHDVSQYANAEVNVDVAPKLQSKMVEITANGVQDIVADSGYDGLERVTIFTDVPAPVLPYYDGSVTISGGVELISFTIDGDHYEAEAGMTWGEWIESSYNTGGFTCSGDNSKVYTSNNLCWVHSDADVYGSYTIVADNAYELRCGSGSSN